MTEESENIKCPNCSEDKFEYVSITWTGDKNLTLYRDKEGNIKEDWDNSDIVTEVYHDSSGRMFIECMKCEATYNIGADEPGTERLLSIEVKDLSIKNHPSLKEAELATYNAKLQLKKKEFDYLSSNIKRLKEEEKVLQRRVEAGRMATEGKDMTKITRIIKRCND